MFAVFAQGFQQILNLFAQHSGAFLSAAHDDDRIAESRSQLGWRLRGFAGDDWEDWRRTAVAEDGRTEDQRTGSRRLRGRRSGGPDRKPAALRLCRFARDDRENSRTGGRRLCGFAGDERSIGGPAASQETIGRTRGPDASPGGFAIPETASETFGDSCGGGERRWRGSREERERRRERELCVSRKRQRDRGIVIIPLDSLSFSLFQFLSLFSLFRSPSFQHQNLK